jgi:transglutaminase-like putative cysteine protease
MNNIIQILDDIAVEDSDYDISVLSGESIDIDERVSLMIDQVFDSRSQKKVYQILGTIVKNLPPRDWDAEVSAIFHWVQKNIRYTRDPNGVELFRTPRAAIADGIGDCDDMAIMLASLLLAAGYRCRFRVIGLTEGSYEHVYVVVGIPPVDPKEEPERWVPLDPSQPYEPGWEIEKTRIKEIMDYNVDVIEE